MTIAHSGLLRVLFSGPSRAHERFVLSPLRHCEQRVKLHPWAHKFRNRPCRKFANFVIPFWDFLAPNSFLLWPQATLPGGPISSYLIDKFGFVSFQHKGWFHFAVIYQVWFANYRIVKYFRGQIDTNGARGNNTPWGHFIRSDDYYCKTITLFICVFLSNYV